MNKAILTSTIGTLLTLGAATADADVFVDFDPIGVVLTECREYRGVFSIVTPDADGNDSAFDVTGYIPGTEILSAVASFHFNGDNDCTQEKVDIDMTGLFKRRHSESERWQDLGQTPAQITGDYLFERALTGVMVANLESDGTISYRLDVLDSDRCKTNDVTLDWARLTVTTASVPDGGTTVGLLGLGLLGLAMLRRWRS